MNIARRIRELSPIGVMNRGLANVDVARQIKEEIRNLIRIASVDSILRSVMFTNGIWETLKNSIAYRL